MREALDPAVRIVDLDGPCNTGVRMGDGTATMGGRCCPSSLSLSSDTISTATGI